MSEKKVKKYYAEKALLEWRRLAKDPYHRLEFETTMHFLRKYLPRKGLLLDAGGGPGRYTIELVRLGYDVTLVDVTPEMLELAERRMHVRRGHVPGRSTVPRGQCRKEGEGN